MDALRTTVSALSETDPDARDMSLAANRRKAVRLTGQIATVVAAFHRLRQGKAVVPPDPGRSHADDFLRMLNGETARSSAVRALDIALVLHADHELNASTFAARVTAATLSDMHSAITSAIGTLKGPLHGGANEAVLKTLNEIGSLDRVDEEIRARLGRKEKIMGFGHRVYTTEDPRATHLRAMSREVAESSGTRACTTCPPHREDHERGEETNVDFYSASLYSMLGLPADLFRRSSPSRISAGPPVLSSIPTTPDPPPADSPTTLPAAYALERARGGGASGAGPGCRLTSRS
jgi:citrate synthase